MEGSGLLQGFLIPLLWAIGGGFLAFITLWSVYRWLLLRGRLTRFAPPFRLFIYLTASIIFLQVGGQTALNAVGAALLGGGHAEKLLDPLGLVLSVLYVVGALLFGAIVDLFVFDIYMTDRQGRHVPKLLRDALKFVIIVAISAYVLIEVLNVDATALGGGAAVLTLVLGLALQNVLGDLFSGIVLQFERPFVKGDWIHVGDVDGEVVELNWRATRMNTRKNIGVVIPNSVMAKTAILNLNLNTPTTAVDLRVGVEYREPPNRIKSAVMEALLQCADVLRQPPPQVWTAEYGESAVIYNLRFWIRDFRRLPQISDEVMTNIWYVFKRYNITIPWPIRNIYTRTEQKTTPQERGEMVTDLLRQVDLFTPLTRAQLQTMAEDLIPKSYGSGEVLIRQGEEGDSFYVIETGQVEVLVEPPTGGVPQRVAMLGPREFFGEMSLLAGDKRTATVRAVEDTRVVIIGKNAFADVIQDNPEVAAEMASIYYTRSEQLTALHEQARSRADAGAVVESGEKALLRRIQRFFGL